MTSSLAILFYIRLSINQHFYWRGTNHLSLRWIMNEWNMGTNHIIAFWFRPGFTEHFRQFTVDARGGVMSGSDKPGSSPCILPPPSPPFSTTLCSFLLPLCHLSCAHFPKQNWAQLKPCWPIIRQIITRLMIENWRQSHSGRLKWNRNGRLMHFSEQIGNNLKREILLLFRSIQTKYFHLHQNSGIFAHVVVFPSPIIWSVSF